MPTKGKSAHARIHVRVDALTAVRAEEAGYEVEREPRRLYPILTLECAPTDRIALVAADHAMPREDGEGAITIDLSDGPLKLRDESPPIAPDVPGPDRNPLWPKPVVEATFHGPPVHLAADADISELADAVESWLATVPAIDQAHLEECRRRWSEQAQRMVASATVAVSELPDSVHADDRQSALKKLQDLARQARHARDGGLDYDDPDYEFDEYGDHELKAAHSYVNEAYAAVLLACERAVDSGGHRLRGEDIHAELKSVAFHRRDALPARFKKADELGLLDSSIGAARDELLGIAWPGWRPLEEGESLRSAVNPTLEMLEALSAARASDKNERPWKHDPIALGWLTPAQEPVLVSSFLGRTVIRDVVSGAAETAQ